MFHRWLNHILFPLFVSLALLTAFSVAAESVPADSSKPVYDAAHPEPGSEGDTLTREDARMAYLVYKLLDKNGKIKGANLKRGEKLFYENCRHCHDGDGRRVNFTPEEVEPTYIGKRARNDMPTFWYQVNFGDDERGMEAYIDEFTLEEITDIAGYAQTLP